MTMKTKRILATTGGTALSAVLAVLIATQFKPEPEITAESLSTESTQSVVSVEKLKPTQSEVIEIPETSKPTETVEKQPTESEIDDEIKEFIENGGNEVKQDFTKPEKESKPPEPPKLEDEAALTNPTKEPNYEPAQTEIIPDGKTENTPLHGEKKDGKIYINGFGWITDEGGGGDGVADSEMYQNGNKIGFFG